MCMLERLVPVPLRPQRPPLVAVLGSPWVAPVGAEVDLLVGQPGFPGSNLGAPLGGPLGGRQWLLHRYQP